MPNVILHIGQSKTGSSSIQQTLQKNRTALMGHGYCYPAPKHIDDSHRYLSPLTRDRDRVTQMTVNAMGGSYDACLRMAEEERVRVRQQCQGADVKTVILSTEVIFGKLETHEREKLQQLMDELGRNLRILAYLRNPASHYMSQCQQRLKVSRLMPRPFVNSRLSTIEAYSSHPGGRFECRAFDRKTLRNGDVVDDFLEWAGVDVDLDRSGRIANESMSAEAMAVLQRLGLAAVATTAEDFAFQRRLTRHVRDLDATLPGATKPVLNPDIANFIIRANTELTELRDRHGIVFSDVDYDLVGKTRNLGCPEFGTVEKLCKFDAARSNELERQVRRKMRPKWLQWLP